MTGHCTVITSTGNAAGRGTTRGREVAIRPADGQQNYRDLRARAKRHERSRDRQVQRIVGLQKERHLHSFQSASAPASVAVLLPAASRDGWRIEVRIAA
jgi:hypothetical protein